MTAEGTTPTSVLLVGLDGFGRQHLRNLRRLSELGRARLIAGASYSDPGPEVRGDIPVHKTLAEAREAGHRPDVVIISTPINTHHDLALEALAMGADVLLEKPPTATFAQFEDLLAAAERAGRRVQVGFQSIGSHALPALEELLSTPEAPGGIGELRAVGATGLWLRREAYYARAPWAGRRVLDGVQVVDGVVTNPLAHAVRTALHIAGARDTDDVAGLATELHHAHRIEADDTSIVSLRTTAGIPVTAALTLCAPEDHRPPWVTIYGTEGQAQLYYTEDRLEITPNREAPFNAGEAGRPRTVEFARTDLLENLLDVREGRAEALLSPLREAGAFMRVLEAVRTAEDPAPIEERHVQQVDSGPERHPVIPHIEDYLARAVKAPSTFSSLGAPWAASAAASGELSLPGGPTIAQLRTGEDISPTDSPRPFLDQVRTRAGVVVTDQQPLDHTWHLGVNVALQDVDGTNFWGGRTYVRSAGRYIWRDDHGRILTRAEQIDDVDDGQRLTQQLEWLDRSGEALLREERTVTVTARDESAWELDVAFALTPAVERPVSLGSPGSNGRVGGGYGGFFWRLPALADAQIFTAEASGEEAVHGSVSDWLAVSGRFGSVHGPGDATLVLVSTDEDPWFVRHAGYPGVGMSLAWDSPVLAAPDEPVARRVRVAVVDGLLDRAEAAALGSGLSAELTATRISR
ncbi:DUF6807 family protein [Nesterenkonia xinjiangensis]|uniref:Putative dehydrogenase n=1 Tax=Nesterenkonia xinjiangensis TaxID=225327 RepID=A0A7Z0GKU4_9MICC|nr:DUF6807 family protein [Nesterenkonia xinjiangensis]NYJ77867.1 putative dehydrogenase [Nesterenkonia xinjiangensis]